MSEARQLEVRLAQVERRLAVMEDVAAIHDLKARYADLVDARYAKGVDGAGVERLAAEIAALFTQDAVWDGGKALGVCLGREEVRRRMAEPSLAFSRHYFVRPQIAVDGDLARGTWELLSPFTTREGRPMWMAGVEHDAYARVDGVWLHSEMRLETVLLAPYERGWARSPEA